MLSGGVSLAKPPVFNPDEMETLVLPTGQTPHVPAPPYLQAVMAELLFKSPVRTVDHTAQYKKQFKARLVGAAESKGTSKPGDLHE